MIVSFIPGYHIHSPCRGYGRLKKGTTLAFEIGYRDVVCSALFLDMFHGELHALRVVHGRSLLEIAEWRILRHLVKRMVGVNAIRVPFDRLAAVRQSLLDGEGEGGTSRLRPKMGDVYASACLICLNESVADSGPLGANESVQGNILDHVVRQLQGYHE